MFIEFYRLHGSGFTSEALYSEITKPDRRGDGGRRAEMIVPMRLHDEAGRIPWQDNC
jgi:hypothetical protein